MKKITCDERDNDRFDNEPTIRFEDEIKRTLVVPISIDENNLDQDEQLIRRGKTTEVIFCGEKVTTTYKATKFVKNEGYNAFKCYLFLFLHAIPAMYFGFQMTLMNNLGEPIVNNGMGISDNKEVANTIGDFNLFFGIGKMFGSVFGGSVQKKFGKRNILYFNEILTIASCTTGMFGNYWVFVISRICVGFYCGNISTNASRIITECFPIKKRGPATSFFSMFVCLGVMISFSIGKIFGDEFLDKNWRAFIIGSSSLVLIRAILLFLFINHDTPIYYLRKSMYADNEQEAEKYEKRADDLISRFNANKYDIEFEKLQIEEIVKGGEVIETSLWELIKFNCIDKRTRYSCLAVLTFNIFPPLAGQAYTDNYSTQIFDLLAGKGFGYTVTFYSGILAFVGGISAVLFVERMGRSTLIIISFMTQIFCLWLMSLSFYFEMAYLAAFGNMLYTYSIYFGTIGVCYIYPNEIAQPFVLGIGCFINWFVKSVVSKILPFIYLNTPLCVTPMILSTLGLIVFIFIRPFYLESKGKTLKGIYVEFANFKYNLFAR